MNRVICFICCLLLISFPCHATLQKMFERLGSESNISSPGSFQDQAAGYYTGGGMVMRQKSKVIQPFNVSLPRMSMGCGGIDMYFGSFSMMKGQEMVQLLRSMATGMPVYAFQLGLKTMAPQLENLMTQLRKNIQDMNALMLDSCQMSQNIVGGLWPKGTEASEQICKDSVRGGGEDWFGAQKHCQKEGEADRQVVEAQKKNPDLLHGEYNLTWHVLKKIPGYSEDKDFAYFVMTAIGTVISRKDDKAESGFKIHTIEGKADHEDFLQACLKGGQLPYYLCDEEDKCLHPKPASYKIDGDGAFQKELQTRIQTQKWEQVDEWAQTQGKTPEEVRKLTSHDKGREDGYKAYDNWRFTSIMASEGMKKKTSNKIRTLFNKYVKNQKINGEELAFLSDALSVPVYKYIQVSAAVGSEFMLEDTCEYIGFSVLLTQFDKVAAEILSSLDNLQDIQLTTDTIEGFKSRIQSLRTRLHAKLAAADGQALWRLHQLIRSHEQALMAKSQS